MPNIKSAKKRVIIAETRRMRNMARKAAMKLSSRSFLPLLQMAIKPLPNAS